MFTHYLSQIDISKRLFILVSTMTSILILTGVLMASGLGSASITTNKFHRDIQYSASLSEIYNKMNQEFVVPINNLSRGTSTWVETNKTINNNLQSFHASWDTLLQSYDKDERAQVEAQYSQSLTLFYSAIDEIIALGKSQNRGNLSLFMLNDFNLMILPLTMELQKSIQDLETIAEADFNQFQTYQLAFISLSLLFVALGIGIAVALGSSIRTSITTPISKVVSTVETITLGDFDARTHLQGTDELAKLSNALDTLLDDKVATLVETEKENEELNNSIIRLLEATSQMSEKDLTVTIPVSEDITGPVADAMNLVSMETAKVLNDILSIAEKVEFNASNVKRQGDKVSKVAESERSMVNTTIERLENASKTMNIIAKLSKSCNSMADDASNSSDKAFEAVTSTVKGMDEIRGTISETEKRIKRLGERSQEISVIVDLINNIAERTHILALNASMHAAAAGEAGRGFAVVADEVQRLAESSRNATSQIAALVSNIQNETQETMATMNESISQVVSGSDRAVQAGQMMQETQEKTNNLALAVAKIAERSLQQAKLNERLKVEAHGIQEKTKETDTELQQQSSNTHSLVTLSNNLLESVGTFTLPNNVVPINEEKKAS
ncbi:MAG: HAMP domain-containing protein [Pseudomonadales bacterium]|nr:HAMP domain-containing protein [Pseudomonadales bacterium]